MHDLVAKARSLIYGKATPITGASVEEILKPTSLVPTLVRASPRMLVVLLTTHRHFSECVL